MLGFWVLGIAAIVRGVAMWSTPAAWVVVGAALIAMALWPLWTDRRVR